MSTKIKQKTQKITAQQSLKFTHCRISQLFLVF